MEQRYSKLKVLGKGSFGRAWLVEDKLTSDKLVAKEIRCANSQELDEALQEAEVLSKLVHFNIVKYREVMRTSSRHVTIVMEYADDGDIAEKITKLKIRHQTFEEPLVLWWMVQVCQALLYLHNQGILHRDIKTANLFLKKGNFVKLGDFGIARVLDKNADRMSARTCSTPVGTPMYMSPQVCLGEPYNQKADVWALGCTLYEICTLRPAFTAQTMQSLMAKIKRGHRDRRFPSHGYTDELRDLIFSMINVEPEERPSVADICQHPLLQPYLARAPATIQAQGGDPLTALPPTAEECRAAAEGGVVVKVTSAPEDACSTAVGPGGGSSGVPLWRGMVERPSAAGKGHRRSSSHESALLGEPGQAGAGGSGAGGSGSASPSVAALAGSPHVQRRYAGAPRTSQPEHAAMAMRPPAAGRRRSSQPLNPVEELPVSELGGQSPQAGRRRSSQPLELQGSPRAPRRSSQQTGDTEDSPQARRRSSQQQMDPEYSPRARRRSSHADDTSSSSGSSAARERRRSSQPQTGSPAARRKSTPGSDWYPDWHGRPAKEDHVRGLGPPARLERRISAEHYVLPSQYAGGVAAPRRLSLQPNMPDNGRSRPQPNLSELASWYGKKRNLPTTSAAAAAAGQGGGPAPGQRSPMISGGQPVRLPKLPP